MTTVYFDTSIIMNESFLRSAYAQAILKACSLLNIAVAIPDIVIDETLGNYPKKLNVKARAYEAARKDLAKIADLEAPAFSKEGVFDAYEAGLNALLEKHEVTVIAYPDVGAKELVEKAYECKKPFDEKGIGHKDYIVWRSIKDHIEDGDAQAPHIFLTNNTRDFCDTDDNDNVILHDDLSSQIADDALKPKVYTSLKAFYDAELLPNLEGVALADIPDLNAETLDELTSAYLGEELPQRTAYGIEGVPFSNEVSIVHYGGHQIEDTQLSEFEDDVIIEVSGTVEIEVTGFVEKHAFYLDDEEGLSVNVIDGDWNDHVMLVGTTVETAFVLSIVYSKEDSAVAGYNLSLPQEIDAYADY
ncbi:PIN domain-containing protein [Hyphomonas pacifica]|uniref:DUF4935 domain-containing protein n=1 Tax=Hyphomonas pacifica TaxID=1280941 RepID=A0A062U4F6_9PROT|nr:PIN domain-containing protein [Hyphomonas pacifica]KCZ52633.1 hypothetical protein HY2_07780 [Hyphomonas pacifica]RAN32836.1 hypothetical protein HY3_13970 [Hyphomonas pacifica]